MNVGDIKLRVKRTFGDESGVQIDDTDILRWINDATQEIANANGLTETKVSTNAIMNQASYGFPPNCNNIRTIKYQGNYVQNISLAEADETVNNPDDFAQFPVGTPLYWWAWAGSYVLYPKPDANITGGITVYYSSFPFTVTSDTDVPGIGIEYHPRIVEYCLTQAYELDEDWEAVQAKQSQYVSALNDQLEEEKWTGRQHYPVITILDEDY